MPVALISTRTSPAFGPSRSSSTISSGFFASNATAARVFILCSYYALQHRKTYHHPRMLVHVCPTPSFDPRATGFGGFGGRWLVFVFGWTTAGNGVVGARAQIDVDVVEIAHHVHVRGELRHHLVVGGVNVFAAIGDDIGEVGVAQRLQ